MMRPLPPTPPPIIIVSVVSHSVVVLWIRRAEMTLRMTKSNPSGAWIVSNRLLLRLRISPAPPTLLLHVLRRPSVLSIIPRSPLHPSSAAPLDLRAIDEFREQLLVVVCERAWCWLWRCFSFSTFSCLIPLRPRRTLPRKRRNPWTKPQSSPNAQSAEVSSPSSWRDSKSKGHSFASVSYKPIVNVSRPMIYFLPGR